MMISLEMKQVKKKACSLPAAVDGWGTIRQIRRRSIKSSTSADMVNTDSFTAMPRRHYNPIHARQERHKERP